MTTLNELTETLNNTIDEANADIEKLDTCNECMANRIEDNRHLISWNEGCIAHAEFTLEEIEKGQKTAITPAKPVHGNDLRTRLAAALHDHTTYWMKVAIAAPDLRKEFLDKTFDELAAVDRVAPLRDADHILDVVRGEE